MGLSFNGRTPPCHGGNTGSAPVRPANLLSPSSPGATGVCFVLYNPAMARRDVQKRPTFRALIEYLRHAANPASRWNVLLKAQANYTCLELYNCNDFTSGINKQCVDGLVRTAMRKFYCSKPYPVRLAATWLLAMGFVLWRMDEEDAGHSEETGDPLRVFKEDKWVLEDANIIKSAKFRHGELREVVIEYQYEQPVKGREETETWVFRGTYSRDMLRDTSRYDWIKYPLDDGDDSNRKVTGGEDLALWPYRGVEWYTRESFIAPVFPTILRYESVLQNIAHENDRHTRRVKTYSGVGTIEKVQDELVEEGRETIPMGGKAEYLDTHPEGIAPMFEERQVLEDEIRQTLGIVKVKELHNASGVSREIEITPLLSQCEALRSAIKDVVAIIDPAAIVHFGPLQELDPQQLEVQLRTFRSSWIDNVINDDEYTQLTRMAHNLPEQPVIGGPVKANKTAANLELMDATKRAAV